MLQKIGTIADDVTINIVSMTDTLNKHDTKLLESLSHTLSLLFGDLDSNHCSLRK